MKRKARENGAIEQWQVGMTRHGVGPPSTGLMYAPSPCRTNSLRWIREHSSTNRSKFSMLFERVKSCELFLARI